MTKHGTAEQQWRQNGTTGDGGRPGMVAVVVQDTSAPPPHGVRFLIQPRCSSPRWHNRSMTLTLITAPSIIISPVITDTVAPNLLRPPWAKHHLGTYLDKRAQK